MFFKVFRELLVHDGVDQGTDIGIAELLLGLAFKLCFGKLDGDDRRDAFPDILAGDLVIPLDDVVFLSVGIDDAGQGRLKTGLVHAAFRRMNVVCKGDQIFTETVVILHRDLGDGVALTAGEIDDILMDRGLVLVEPGDKFTDTSLIAHAVALLLSFAQIFESNL